jgi:lipopolysaccharide/colanic/teichoic acid biosynthesis glycosyltransferase
MCRRQRRLLVWGVMLLDVVAAAGAVLAARDIISLQPEASAHSWPPLLLLAAVVPVVIGLCGLNRLYVLDEVLEGSTEYGRVVYACTLAALSLSVFEFWGGKVGEGLPSRRLVVVVWMCLLVALLGVRFLDRRIVRALRRRGHLVSRALVVGLGAPGVSLARYFHDARHAGIRVVGFIDDYLSPGTPVTDGLKVLGPPSALPEILQQTHAHEIIVVPTAMAWESFHDLIGTATSVNGQAIRLASGFGDILATSVRVHQFGSVPLLTIERVRITGLDALVKAVLGYGTALVLLPVALLIMAVLAPALALAGVRPFTRVRVLGRGGKQFTTVLLNADAAGCRAQRLIHHLGLARVPQVLNVLLGQMSIVGPRPVPVDRRAEYARWLPNLLAVKPGMTAPWATQGPPASLDEEMRMNLFYIRNYTVWMDFEIAVRSLRRLFAAVVSLRSAQGGGTIGRVHPAHDSETRGTPSRAPDWALPSGDRQPPGDWTGRGPRPTGAVEARSGGVDLHPAQSADGLAASRHNRAPSGPRRAGDATELSKPA